MFSANQGNNAISFTQFLGADYNRLIPVQRHGTTLVKVTSEERD